MSLQCLLQSAGRSTDIITKQKCIGQQTELYKRAKLKIVHYEQIEIVHYEYKSLNFISNSVKKPISVCGA